MVSCDASEIDAQVKKLTEPCQDPRLRDYPNRFVAMTVDLEDGRFFLFFVFFCFGGRGGNGGRKREGERKERGEKEEKGEGENGRERKREREREKEGKRKERWKGRAGKGKMEGKEKREKKEKTGCINVMGMYELLEKSQDANPWSFSQQILSMLLLPL